MILLAEFLVSWIAEEFQRCFICWVESIRKHLANDIIAIDRAKLLGVSVDTSKWSTLPFHLVSAWSSENELSLGQVQVTKKSNEITAIPKLIKAVNDRRLHSDLGRDGMSKSDNKG